MEGKLDQLWYVYCITHGSNASVLDNITDYNELFQEPSGGCVYISDLFMVTTEC